MKKTNSSIKRLFLFAGYDKDGIIDETLIFYLRALSIHGDIVMVMDSDAKKSEIKKVSKYTLYCAATKHGEYDFGSYKRAYIWSKENLDLSKYDFVYLINDSVYGPLYSLDKYFTQMETYGTHAFGLVKNPHKTHPHIQSWFIGCDCHVFLSSWFDQFITSVTTQPSKGKITKLYEQGFSKHLANQDIKWHCLYCVPGRDIYNKVLKLYKKGIPFIKKAAFPRHNGALGRQLSVILDRLDDSNLRDAILLNARRTYGTKYINWLLTKNPIKIIIRNVTYSLRKLFIEGL